MSCRRSSRFWGLGCPKIFHEIEDSFDQTTRCTSELNPRWPLTLKALLKEGKEFAEKAEAEQLLRELQGS